jgi:hypothetical protein
MTRAVRLRGWVRAVMFAAIILLWVGSLAQLVVGSWTRHWSAAAAGAVWFGLLTCWARSGWRSAPTGPAGEAAHPLG